MLKPIRGDRKTVYEQVLYVLHSYITEGDLKPGDRLPSERELAASLNVSRASVREAIKILSAGGLVEVKHGRGIFISEKGKPESIIEKSDSEKTVTKNIKDFLEIRRALELQAVEWVVSRAKDEELENLQELVERTKNELNDKDEGSILSLAEHDTRFHECLAKYTGNDVLLSTMKNLLTALSEARLNSLRIDDRPKRCLDEHQEIVKALMSRRLSSAKEAMDNHLSSSESIILSAYNH